MKTVEDHPIEDIFGDEITSDDVYFVFGRNIVLESNLKTYLIQHQFVECFRAS